MDNLKSVRSVDRSESAPRVVFTVPDFVDTDGISYTDIEVIFESDSLLDASNLATTLLK